MRLSSDYSNVDTDLDDWMNKIPCSDQVEKFCWERLGKDPEFLVKRYENQMDRIVEDKEVYSVYQLGNTRIRYRIRETSGLPGLKIDAIWEEEEEYEEGEI